VSVGAAIARLLPQRLRSRGRDWFEMQFRGTPAALLPYRAFGIVADLDMVLSHYRITHPDVLYLQIGAFDGISGDPIYPLIERHSLRGIVVEPQKDAFERLKSNYAHFHGFHFVNAAIADHDGWSTLYRIKPEAQGPEWLHQIASFDRSVLMKHAQMVPGLESIIQTEEVQCLTFSTLFKQLGLERIDMLQIDAEGFDAKLLDWFEIGVRKPPIVRFEHKHLSTEDHEHAIAALVENGYGITAVGTDTLAYLRSFNGEHSAR
jgi:FkbM family methyltransferase